MLILTRKPEESIIINDNIEICIVEIGEGYVKIGINAPKSVKILRKEIIVEIKEENEESLKNIDKILSKIK